MIALDMNKIIIIFSVVMMMASGAHAVTVHLMSGGDLSISRGMGTFDVQGVSGKVTAHSISPFGRARVAQTRDGIGVKAGRFDDTRALDGLYDEWLKFTFDTAVRLVSVVMSRVDRNDDWDIFVGHRRVANESRANAFYFGDVIASSFSVRADDHRCHRFYCKSTDNFVIKNFTVAPVPLPATGLLLIGGLVGLGFVRRRKKFA
ncbi:VPLPA-CTERM sorting domain-containing protein [Ruegeria arenilitoris]|uniref:VPLPA-CTERM sorting domain-containing protein n=1 Tax=Ruegeria arenilitoris TaxID=1173585 RepID=UPI00147EA9BE|nr:VPLPA-CTERM sorting domain-containing protein [Ruegeria arenilitoris]